jgi:DNA polymerase III delta prime subunit
MQTTILTDTEKKINTEINLIKTESSKIIEQGKNIVYTILKRKPLNTEEILKQLEKEIEKRFQDRIKEITPSIENAKFDNPETSLKLILVKVMIEILDALFFEKMIALDEEDKKIVNDVFK